MIVRLTFFFFGRAPQLARSYLVPWPGIKPRPWQWKHWVLTTGPPGNPQTFVFWREFWEAQDLLEARILPTCYFSLTQLALCIHGFHTRRRLKPQTQGRAALHQSYAGPEHHGGWQPQGVQEPISRGYPGTTPISLPKLSSCLITVYTAPSTIYQL